MWINPFVCGVLATILVEVLIVIGIAITQYTKNNKNGGNKNV